MTQENPATSQPQPDPQAPNILGLGNAVLAWSNAAAVVMAFVAIQVLRMQMLQMGSVVWPGVTRFLLHIPLPSYALLMGLAAIGVLALDRSIKNPTRRLVANMLVSVGLVIILVSLILALFIPFMTTSLQ